jgi:periplasmic protein TonB
VVTVAGVLSGLGHGLDESAVRAAQGTRFDPALDASGRPVDCENRFSTGPVGLPITTWI